MSAAKIFEGLEETLKRKRQTKKQGAKNRPYFFTERCLFVPDAKDFPPILFL